MSLGLGRGDGMRAFAHGAHYVLNRMKNGKVMAKFLGVVNGSRPSKIWIPKTIMPPPLPNPNAKWRPAPKVAPIHKWVPKSHN